MFIEFLTSFTVVNIKQWILNIQTLTSICDGSYVIVFQIDHSVCMLDNSTEKQFVLELMLITFLYFTNAHIK